MKFATIFLLATGLLIVGSISESHGLTQISISTSKPVYTYGENLSFLVTVSNVTGSNAVLEIIDQSNQSSGPIPMIITKPTSNFTAPFPFYRTTYATGTYFLKVQYVRSKCYRKFSDS
ncbi:hypothetical protein DYY67_1336 [Candidatus Nitrosotalea sp. TS]|uniref:hypothetical protein n=1 Tax=Candidatus Nitrosotalea sp. TS TaxID=2341020 RepID=UPI00140C74DA|nr:hypothetical protein [Candidatus Nitrosotalea sp. TS]NHI03541.1 hypothetical protein [Candidatus Nitrosotalea sp. TS]